MKDDADREIAIFTEALKVPPQERAAFLENACRGDENLRRKVDALLRVSDRSGDFLEEPAIPAGLASLLRQMATTAKPKRRKYSQTSFQDQRRKRKGK
jgi:hypothetical protein